MLGAIGLLNARLLPIRWQRHRPSAGRNGHRTRRIWLGGNLLRRVRQGWCWLRRQGLRTKRLRPQSLRLARLRQHALRWQELRLLGRDRLGAQAARLLGHRLLRHRLLRGRVALRIGIAGCRVIAGCGVHAAGRLRRSPLGRNGLRTKLARRGRSGLGRLAGNSGRRGSRIGRLW